MTAVLIFLAALVVLAAVYLILIRPTGRKMPAALRCEYAHRGLHGGEIPENSMAAFAAACDAGYGIELDVQLSRDGEVMVFHDDTLTRMTGQDARLASMTAAELAALRLGGTDAGIPRFAEVLALVRGRVPILVELKGESLDTSLCEKTAALLRDYAGAYCFESFNPLLVGGMKKYLPEARRGILYTNVCKAKGKVSALNLLLTAMALNIAARPDFIAYDKAERRALPVRITTGLLCAEKFVWTMHGDAERADAAAHGEHAIFETR